MELDFFSKNIRFLRTERKLKQSDVADSLGISRGSVTNYENGISKPDFNTLEKLMHYFNVTATELISSDLEKNEDFKNPNPLNTKWANTALEALAVDWIQARNLFGSDKNIEFIINDGTNLGSAITTANLHHANLFDKKVDLLVKKLGKINPYKRNNSEFLNENKKIIDELKEYCLVYNKSLIELDKAISKIHKNKDFDFK